MTSKLLKKKNAQPCKYICHTPNRKHATLCFNKTGNPDSWTKINQKLFINKIVVKTKILTKFRTSLFLAIKLKNKSSISTIIKLHDDHIVTELLAPCQYDKYANETANENSCLDKLILFPPNGMYK